ncbi:HsdM family class I SAM-dependent methyltransferase [Lawsonella clevelandensis]|uniref:HsdM family class I SAM-dependent methyltransferase n=1 Tax=Lawsonella clevelandensis TaxID=1528099 RepID=UPI00214E2795|nr:SAM-dependent methyltransferase [Lawsonella clevelandensis]
MDPTCGTGGMLIESVAAVEADGGDSRTLSLYGQEKNLTTQSIARMNMYIHNLPDHNIMRGDTLREPKFTDGDALKQFDVVIAKRWLGQMIRDNGVCEYALAA